MFCILQNHIEDRRRMQEEHGAPAAKRVCRNASVSITLADSDVLDCPICCGPFSAPVYQCENGHIVCTTCRNKIKNDICPFDRSPIAYTRNRMIEKLLESVKSVSCKNAEFGCNEILGYLQKNDHEKACKHSPCSCPLSGCDFLGSSSQLYQHFRGQHQNSSTLFRYDQDFNISLDANNDRFLVLLEARDDNILFTLHNTRNNQQQNGLSISCISSSREARNEYKISVSFGSKNGSSLTFRSAISSSEKQLDNLPKLGFPLVPWLLDAIDGRLNLEVCIFKDRLPHWLC